MDDRPPYSVAEFILAGLCIGGGLSFLVYAGVSLSDGHRAEALEGAGLSLLLLGGSVSPFRYVVDCLTFPFTFTIPTGRESKITMLAAGLGTLLWLAGVATNWLQRS